MKKRRENSNIQIQILGDGTAYGIKEKILKKQLIYRYLKAKIIKNPQELTSSLDSIQNSSGHYSCHLILEGNPIELEISKDEKINLKVHVFVGLFSVAIPDSLHFLLTTINNVKSDYPNIPIIIVAAESEYRSSSNLDLPTQENQQAMCQNIGAVHYVELSFNDEASVKALFSKVASVGYQIKQLMSIEKSFFSLQLVEPNRKFIKEGPLKKICKKDNKIRWFFLFSDILLYATPLKKKKEKDTLSISSYNTEISSLYISDGSRSRSSTFVKPDQFINPKLFKLNQIAVQNLDNFEDLRYAFKVLSSEIKSFVVFAQSNEEKEGWLQEFAKYTPKNLNFSLPIWLPDTSTNNCLLCNKAFSLINRRHHCRFCGKIICASCSMNRIKQTYLHSKPVRVCKSCFSNRSSILEDFIEINVDNSTSSPISELKSKKEVDVDIDNFLQTLDLTFSERELTLNTFMKERVDMKTLITLNEEDLRELNIKLGTRKKIIAGTERLKTNEDNILITDVEIKRKLGGGNFGEVFLAIWKQTTKIAVKRLNSDDQSNFKKELAILKKLSHPNIITFYGIFKDNESIYLAMEFMELGNLLNYLQFKRTDLKLIDLIRMAKDCAAGMEYLSSRDIVHRDLAARNILAKEENRRLICKVSDFGLSRNILDNGYSLTNTFNIPAKWTAPEVFIEQKHTLQSDIWGYGILLQEIFTFGEDPFPTKKNTEVKKMLMNKEPFPVAPNLSPKISELILSCCNYDIEKRPSFLKILQILKSMEAQDEEEEEKNPSNSSSSSSSQIGYYTD